MKLKISVFVIIFVMLISNFALAVDEICVSMRKDDIHGLTHTFGDVEKSVLSSGETKEIRVAILTGEKLIISMAPYFIEMLTNYQWLVGDTQYRFDVKPITDDDILKGKLNTDNYDLIVVPGGGVGDGEAWVRAYPSPENFKWKRNFAQFIKDGGGYFSVCGGTALITDLDLDRKPKSYLEYAYENSDLGVTCVKSHYETIANPLFCQFAGLPPEYPGVNPYCMYSGFNLSDPDVSIHYTGVCLDCKIFKDNPIFKDYFEDTRRIRWISGPSLVIPENPDREVKILAKYPQEEISDNKSTRIHAWRYTGGIRGLVVKGLIKAIKNKYESGSTDIFGTIYAFAGDWKKTDKIIETDYSNKVAITAEIYPNKNKARIVLSGPHTEDNVWWGGYIQETEDNNENNLWDALFKWVNINHKSKALEWEYNYWINRRIVAWVSKKVPDNHLPPTYGSSEVCDAYPYVQPQNFKIIGIVEPSNGITFLDLYYRFSENNHTWSDWTFYGTSIEGASWEFYASALNGEGYYEFYSIRRVEFEYSWEYELLPPGPDTRVYVKER